MKLKLIISLVAISVFGTVQAQLTEECAASYNIVSGKTHGSKQDQAGNIYIFGKNGPNPFILKYGRYCDTTVLLNSVDKINNELESWYGVNDSAFVSDITFGEDSSLYVVGTVKKRYTSELTFLLKIKNQDTVWSTTNVVWDLSGWGTTRWHYPSKIKYNSFDSCLYMISTSIKSAPGDDVLVMKFDNFGKLIKYQIQNGILITNGNDIASDLTLHDSLIIVSSQSQVSALGYNLLTFALDTSLSRQWIQSEGQKNSSNLPLSLQMKSNNIYLFAETKDSLVVNPKTSTIIKYSVSGEKLWRRDFNLSSTSTDVPQSFSLDEKGGCALAVISNDAQNYKRSVITLYDSAGNHLKTIEGEDSSTFFQAAFYGRCNLVSYLYKEGLNQGYIAKYCNRDYSVAWQVDYTTSISPLQIFYSDSFLTLSHVLGSQTHVKKYTDQSLISPPENIVFTKKAARSIELEWQASPSNIQGYYVLRGTNLGNLVYIDTLPPLIVEYKDSSLQPATRYYYQIAAYGTSCDFCPTQIFSDSTLLNVNINNIKDEESFLVFPNPVAELLSITSDQDFEYSISDILGRTHLSGTYYQSIDCSFLGPGVYLLNIFTENNSRITYKILKL